MARRKLSLDFESRSRCDLRACGSYRYWEDTSTKILVLAVREWPLSDKSKKVLSWDVRLEPNEAVELLREAIVDGWEIHAYNSQFEWGGLKYKCPEQLGLPVPDINNLRCTAAVCRSAGLQPRLGQVAEFLKLPVQKDKAGATLIQKFSIPQKNTGEFIEWNDDVELTIGGRRMRAADAFQMFVDYCETDVLTEMSVAHAMRMFALKGYALDSFLLTARLNDRGVPVDVEALGNAMRLYKEQEKELTAKFRALTGLAPAQNARVLEWCKERGYPAKSLNKASREAHGKDGRLTPECRAALDIKGRLSFAAIKKIPAMLDWVMADGKIRGSFKWCGAQKTWRWTSEGPQWQNMKKPPKRLRPRIEDAFQDVKRGVDLLSFELAYGDPYETIASMARYFVRFPDRGLLDLDFTSVEAMILPALIDCNRLLEKFRRGEDTYVDTGTALAKTLKEKYDVPFEINRDTAKTVVLATQFQGGWHAVFTATGQTWKREWCEAAAAVIRKENPEFPKGWRAFQDAFVEALDNPGRWVKATRHVKLGYSEKPPFPRMVMVLPSGRPIVMPLPEKDPMTMVRVDTINPLDNEVTSKQWERLNGHEEDEEKMRDRLSLDWPSRNNRKVIGKWFHTWELSYWGHTEGVNYGRVHTYGGSVLQSATQGTGVDLLALGAINAEAAGFDPFFLVHDQCLTPDDGRKDEFERAMCIVPDWFKGFPLSASADSVRSYCKT